MERKEKERDRERESEKGGGQKRLGRKKGNTDNKQKMPVLGEKQGFSMKNKERKGTKQKKQKKATKKK